MATMTADRTLVAQQDTKARRKFSWTPYLFILPHLIFFGTFIVWPLINGLIISFQQYDYLRPEQNKFVGLQNYTDLFSPGTLTTDEFWDSMKNTAIFVLISLPPLVIIPLLLAVLLNSKIPGRNLFRGIYFAPWVLSVTVVGLLWWWIFQSSGGLINYYWAPTIVPALKVVYYALKFILLPLTLILLIAAVLSSLRPEARVKQRDLWSLAAVLALAIWLLLVFVPDIVSLLVSVLPVVAIIVLLLAVGAAIRPETRPQIMSLLAIAVVLMLWQWFLQAENPGITAPRWLSSLPWAWVSILIATVWWTIGFNMIILLAALQDIPDQLYEAASLDGASPLQTFWRVTVPMLRPVLLFVVTITIIASFNLFGQPFLMTNGGPTLANGTGATTPVMYRIYVQGFVRPFQGSAAAMSFVVAAIMIIFSYLNFKIFRQRETD